MQLEEHTDIDLLITRYLSGKMDKESFAELKRWSLESESNRKYVRNKLEVWFSSGAADTAVRFDKDKAFSLFRQRVAGAEKKQKQMLRFSWKTFMRVAAVVLILMIPFVTYWQGKQAVKQNFADMVVEAPMGAHTKLYLPDGTLVWLNAGSKIIYSQGFGVDDRRLRLEGEGYFEVTKQNGKQFTVKTHEYDVVVKGTKFNVSAYSDDSYITTTLLEGAVELNYKKDQIRMSPGESISLDLATGQLKGKKVNARQAMAWAEDRIEYDDITLGEMVKKLSRQYDVHIQLESEKLGDMKFRVSLRNKETIVDVMDALKEIIPIKVEYKEKDIYIR